MKLLDSLRALSLAVLLALAGCATPGSGEKTADASSLGTADVTTRPGALKPLPSSPDIIQPLAAAQASSQAVAMLRPPADLWERIRRGFAMPNLESDLVRDREQWYATRPDCIRSRNGYRTIRATRASNNCTLGKAKYFFIGMNTNRSGLPSLKYLSL